ncbi:MAG TPA: dihydroorotate dehydrogenase-like protein [Ignavibacteriaceae bacterium]|nr:dihydroorotate dehydrogenase-like protein [Ignavibacteriaceae bacterium]
MDLSTTYLNLHLKNPIVPSAGPLTKELGIVKELEDAGAAAVVLHSLFEEQIVHEELEIDHYTSVTSDLQPEATSYFPYHIDFKTGPEEYLEYIRKVKQAVDIPVIASLNGSSLGGWTDYAKKLEQAGADAMELNIYKLATNLNETAEQIENNYVEIVKHVKAAVNIPVAVKLSPYFTSTANIAYKLDKTGVDGLVLFNRFYQPDIDLENLEVVPNVLLSTPMAARLPLRWIAILYNRINADLSATSGIYSEKDVIKMIMAGAKSVQMMSALLKFGVKHLTEVLTKMQYWMEINEYASISQMRGSMSYMNVPDPGLFERSNYMKVLHSYKKD